MFSPEQFLDMQVTDTNDTKTIPVPVGEFTGIIKGVEIRQWVSKKDPSRSGVTLEVTWTIEDPAVQELLGRSEVTCRQGVMLDVLETGGLDMGKGRNVGLGRLREAVDMNTAGVPFSFNALPGRMAKVIVEHEVVGEDVYARINKVARAA